jgi:hypothetical protein
MRKGKKPRLDRRDFLKIGGGATAGVLAGAALPSSSLAVPPLPANPKTAAAMPTRNLGKTGYRVGLFSLGGQAAIELPGNEATAVAIVERALDLGVNYIDTAAMYGRGLSQGYIGQVMKRRRRETFLATKTDDRTRDGSLRLLDESLKLLQTDHVDLWQLHHLTTMSDVERCFAKGGAMEALLQAREQKLVRFLGITGHTDPEVLMEAIRRFPFDSILLALNAADRHRLPFSEKLLPMAVEREMGIVGMKIPARGRLLASPALATTPYKFPAGTKPGNLTMRDALYYVLSLPVSTVIIGCDTVAQLEENVRLAREFTPLSETQMTALAEKTQPLARQALFFRRWT